MRLGHIVILTKIPDEILGLAVSFGRFIDVMNGEGLEDGIQFGRSWEQGRSRASLITVGGI